MKIKNLLLCGMFLGLIACNTIIKDPEKPNPAGTFAKGADMGWLSEMENDGVKFYDNIGTQRECFSLLKDLGMNAVRFRVWVNPTAGYCNKADVLTMAERAKNLNRRIMIDFHYSDFFADPAKQEKPAAWLNYSNEELKQAITDHTVDILTALKDNGIEPEWVQVGNETTNGIFYDKNKTYTTGYLWKSTGDDWATYVEFSNAGYDAVKSVFPNTTVIIHIDNAYKNNNWWYRAFKKNGGKFDMIGLSHYPQINSSKTWSEMNSSAINNIKLLINEFKCRVMVCEIGTKANNLSLATKVMTDFMTQVHQIDSCAGVFYWEPQVYGGWKPAEYDALGWGAYDMGAFTSAGKPMDCLKVLYE